jgi:hypothetical protein
MMLIARLFVPMAATFSMSWSCKPTLYHGVPAP